MSNNFSRSNKMHYIKTKESTTARTRSKYSEDNNSDMESRTPPLPPNISTLEELLKKRESLKKQLKRITKSPECENNKRYKHSNEVCNSELKFKKSHKENKNTVPNNTKTQSTYESSPELNNTLMDSEDEESIIEQRRLQRKQLLKKFETSSLKVSRGEDKTQQESTEHVIVKTIERKRKSKEVVDMFSENYEFTTKANSGNLSQEHCASNLTENVDDPDGYYNIRLGDIINNKYTVMGLLGQGVFANVVRAQDNTDGNDYYAIKIVRNNELMYKTSLKEIAILKEIREADPDNKYHCINFFGNFLHRGHLCILLESLPKDLRGIIKKYSKDHGISMKAMINYSRQLFSALRLLKKLNIIHADIKPDNILVNEKKNILKLCDFGSAAKINENEPTPYLVSRFYRAPEIILGIAYKHSIDIWSAACTIYEMATGKILFTGNSNNRMLKCFMDLKGKFSSKVINKGKFKDRHFNYKNNFLLHKKDETTGKEKFVEMSNISPSRDLHYELKKSYKNSPDKHEKKLAQLKDLLDKMTLLDSNQRISVTDCLKHPFICDELIRNSNKN